MINEKKIKDDMISFTINPKIYSLETIYSTAYVFLDRAYIKLDGDPEKEIIIQIKLKKSQDKKDTKEILEQISNEFLNELINYSDYHTRAKASKTLRETLLQKSLFELATYKNQLNSPPTPNQNVCEEDYDEEFNKILEEIENDDSPDEDPDDIAIPWEEKYGRKVKE
jgi:His-Xaa-Ser system protein HxsD